MKTAKVYFDGVKKDCNVYTDRNGETVFQSEDGLDFIKAPKDADLSSFLSEHNSQNNEEVELSEEEIQYRKVAVQKMKEQKSTEEKSEPSSSEKKFTKTTKTKK